MIDGVKINSPILTKLGLNDGFDVNSPGASILPEVQMQALSGQISDITGEFPALADMSFAAHQEQKEGGYKTNDLVNSLRNGVARNSSQRKSEIF